METLLKNLRFSLRMLGRNPGLTFTVLLTLALGIGANTAIFTVDYATLLAPLPYPKPDQLVMVWSKIQTFHNGVAAGDFTDWKNQSDSRFRICARGPDRASTLRRRISRNICRRRRRRVGMLKMVGQPLLHGAVFSAGGGSGGARSCGDPDAQAVGEAGVEPEHSGDDAAAGWAAVHGGGGAAAGGLRSRAAADDGAAGVQAGAAESRFPLAAGDGAAEAGSDDQAGTGKYGCGDGAYRGDVSEER